MRPLVLTAVGVLAVAVAAWMMLHHAPRPTPPAIESQALLPYDSLKALANRVIALQAQGRYGESLPGARALLRQHALHGKLVPEMLADYARMLNNAAFEAGARAPRSSFERIGLEREALEQCQRALAEAKTPRERAEAVTLVGMVHEAWGFPYDAYLTYRAATKMDPTYAEARDHYDGFLRRLNPATPAKSR
jgi:tetratricopeptide (TPR) repeat protein